MSWRNPRTTNEAPFIKSSKFEREVLDNLNYLKDAVENIDMTGCVMRDGTTVAYASPSGTRVKGTVYQNTSGKIRFVTINCTPAAENDRMEALVGVANPPTIVVDAVQGINIGSTQVGSVTFLVPPSYYYKANESNATITINTWVEWDLF